MKNRISFLLYCFVLLTVVWVQICTKEVYANVVQGTGYSFDTTGGINELTVIDDTGFDSIYLPDSGITKADIKSVIIGAEVTEVAQGAFMDCTALTSVSFDERATQFEIGIDAFNGSGLTSVAIPKELSSVGIRAFKDCTYLTTVTFDERTEKLSINSNAFEGSGITSIHIPNSVTYISGYTFQYCENLTSVTFEDNSSLLYFNSYAFANSGITEITIPKSVTSLGNYSFYGCSDLKSVTFDKEASIATIGTRLFDSTSLRSITIPKSVTQISDSAFHSCKSLTDVYFEPESQLHTINANAFYFSAITNINLPDSLTTIGAKAFRNCNSLKGITIPPNVTSFGLNVFDGTALSYIYFEGDYPTVDSDGMSSITADVKYHAADAIGYDSFGSTAAYTISGTVATASGTPIDTTVTFKENDIAVLSVNTDIFGRYKIPMAVNSSGALTGSFSGLNFSENVTANNHITKDIFITSPYDYNGADGTLTINNNEGITQITKDFSSGVISKTDVKTLIIGALVTNISDSTFSNCTNITEIIFDDNGSLTSIGSDAFQGTKAEKLEIPSSITHIGDNAFGSVPLKWIYFKGNMPTSSNGISSIAQTAVKFYENGATGYDESFTPAYFISGKVSDNANLPLTAQVNIYLNSSPILTISTDKNGDYKIPAPANVALEFEVTSTNYITHFENITPIKHLEDKNITLLASYLWDNSTDTLTILEPEGFTAAFVATSGIKKTNVVNVIIGEKITEIPADAFNSCVFLTNITFVSNDNLTTIGDRAFMSCRLSSATIPSSVTSIGAEAFRMELYDFAVDFAADSKLEAIGSGAFRNSRLGEINIPDSVISIGANAFSNCMFLDEVNFSSTSKLSSIGDGAFSNTKLPKISIPSAVISIGNEAFKDITSLGTVAFAPDSKLQTIGEGAFAYTNLRDFTIPDKVTTIATSVFEGSKYLDTLIFGDNTSVQTIEYNAFKGTLLRSINIPSTVTHIGDSAFENCSELSDFTFAPDSALTSIGANAFKGTAITTIKLPAHVMSVGENAFLDVPLSYVYLNGNYPTGDISGLNSLNSGKFYSPTASGYDNTDFLPVYFVSGIIRNTDNFLSITTVITKVGGNEIAMTRSNGSGNYTIPIQANTAAQLLVVLRNQAYEKTIIATEDLTVDVNLEFAYNFNSGTLEILSEAGLTSIFDGYNDLVQTSVENLIIGENITKIPDNIFSGIEKLRTVTFSENSALTSIGENAFSDCVALNEVNFSATNNLSNIGDSVFENCSQLSNLTFALDSALTNIGANAFKDTAITTIKLPSHIMSVGENAFLGAPLSYVYLHGNYPTGDISGINSLSSDKFCSPTASGYDNTDFIPVYFVNGTVRNTDNILSIASVITKVGGTEFTITTSNSSGNYTIPIQANTTAQLLVVLENQVYEQTINATEDLTVDVNLEFAYNFNSGTLEILSEAGLTSIFDGYNNLVQTSVENLIIGENITKIPDNIFSGSENLRTVTFSENTALTAIGENAFRSTVITAIDIPDTVNAISAGAFANSALSYIYFEGNYYPELQPGLDTLPENTIILHSLGALNWENIARPLTEFDVNKDGYANSADLIEIISIENYNLPTNETVNERCDVNDDGEVNFLDLSIVRNTVNFGK